MATITAKADGNWSSANTWNTRVPLPTDIFDLNAHNVTLDIASISCVAGQNTGGGTLTPADGSTYTINASLTNLQDNVSIITTNGGPIIINGAITNTANSAVSGDQTSVIAVNDGSLVINGAVLNSGNNTTSNVPDDTVTACAAIIVNAEAPVTINGTAVNTGTAASAIAIQGPSSPISPVTITGNVTNGTPGQTAPGRNGAVISMLPAATNAIVNIVGNATNHAQGGSVFHATNLGAGGPSFTQIDISGNYANNDNTADFIGLSPWAQSYIIIHGNHTVPAGKKATDYNAANGGLLAVYGTITGNCFFDNWVFVSTAAGPQNQVNSDGGVWVILGDPAQPHNWTYGTGTALVMVIAGGYTRFYAGNPLTHQPQAIVPNGGGGILVV